MPLTHPLLVPAIRLDQGADAETRLALQRARAPWVAGFILFGGDAEGVARLTADLREAAGRPLFVASDMERGAGQQVAGLTRLPDLGILGLAGAPADARAFGAITAREALEVGIDVVFGPCLDVRSELDNPILGNRAFGFDPQRVADLGAAYAAGILDAGVLPVLKHFPGHGATREDSHEALPVVHADEATLRARDIAPFAAALARHPWIGVMAAHVAYPALDASGSIATFSDGILDRLRVLARAPGGDADALVFTDALMMAGANVRGGEPEAAVRALAAGCDMLLYPEAPEAVAAALADDEVTARAAERRRRFLARRDALEARAAPADDVPAAVASRAVALCAPLPHVDAGLLVLVDDDGIEDRGDVLAAEAAARGLAVLRLRVGADDVPALPATEDGPDGVLAVVFAQARAWKGASGVSAACGALVDGLQRATDAGNRPLGVIWCAPRPGGPFGVHVPGNGPQVERALAAALLGAVAGA